MLVDITRPLSLRVAAWPGDPPLRLEPCRRVADGASTNLALLETGLHLGTHADTPLHLADGAPATEWLVLDAFVGPARVVDASAPIEAAVVEGLGLRGGERVLFRTGQWENSGAFPYGFAAFTREGAQALCDAGVRLVGIDVPSVDGWDAANAGNLAAHRAFFASGVRFLESLDLRRAPPGDAKLLALPLAVEGADAAPVRAALSR
ncbi:MAG TPA: cyclase family protein [Candidatus Thermoplasmatota archaeon]|nr:cyclase family protein [Candidatus Thermoplasmatota archaeon]